MDSRTRATLRSSAAVSCAGVFSPSSAGAGFDLARLTLALERAVRYSHNLQETEPERGHTLVVVTQEQLGDSCEESASQGEFLNNEQRRELLSDRSTRAYPRHEQRQCVVKLLIFLVDAVKLLSARLDRYVPSAGSVYRVASESPSHILPRQSYSTCVHRPCTSFHKHAAQARQRTGRR